MRAWAWAVAASILSVCAVARGEQPPPGFAAGGGVGGERTARFGPVLDGPAKLGAGLEAYAGIAAEATGGTERAHGIVGALLRLRLHYFEIGGTLEITDTGEASSLDEPRLERWRAIGGFAGVMLPYQRWVDVEAAIGVSSRTYENSSSIYGDGGASRALPCLTLRLGVSDRLGKRRLGARLGAALAVSADLSTPGVGWRREYLDSSGATAQITGTTTFGGLSVGLVVSAGFELGGLSVE